jgi:site-specific DNA-methyltransferase (adenine-specific)
MEKDRIYKGDCLEVMRDIPDKSVDCILCDLPFGTTKNSWDSIIPFDPLWEQYNRIIKDDGAIVLFSQQPFTSMLVMSNPKMFKYELIWEKENGTGFLNANHAPLKIHENILVFGKGATSPTKKSVSMTYNPQKIKGKPYTAVQGYSGNNYSPTKGNVTVSDGMRYPTDILRFQRDKNKYHSTQKPVELLQYLIRTYTNEGDVVLDNTMGSGSTIIASIKEKRQYIGIEKDEHFFDIAKKRIENELQQPKSLF